ncbi:MAG: CpaF family protein, partial [Actinobacteria bacterium]|nr:CpaF family protein [Actinomycetota bacterium]
MSLSEVSRRDDDVVDRVRALVRDRGTDPLVDPRAVRAAILDVLDEVIAADLGTSSYPDIDIWAQEIHDTVAGYGPLHRLFEDLDIEEIWFNEPSRVFCARRGRSELTTIVLTETQVHDLVERMLRTSGRRVDVSQPFVDALLPDGSRLHVVIPDVTRRHWAVNIRRHVLAAARLEDLVALGTLTPAAARFLSAAVVAGLNIVVAGGT